MLPIAPWLHVMNIEAALPPRPPTRKKSTGAGWGLRRAVGHTLIVFGKMVAGTDSAASRTVSVGH